jgi:small subunit ribosomal protein S6
MSETETTRLYEAMFLVDANRAGQDWNSVTEHVHGIIKRHNGEIVNSEKWDERKLAYPIKGHARATYILIHFNAPPASIEPMLADIQISDVVLRVLVLRDEDGITSEIKGLSDEPTDPVRSTRRGRDISVPEDRAAGVVASSKDEPGDDTAEETGEGSAEETAAEGESDASDDEEAETADGETGEGASEEDESA